MGTDINFQNGTVVTPDWLNEVNNLKENDYPDLLQQVNAHKADGAYHSQSMARQAIIDGNFQIAQAVPTPGTEVTNPASGTYPVFDLWKLFKWSGTSTFPTIKHSQKALTPGELDKSFYSYKINFDGAGSDLSADSYYYIRHHIENGVRFLCGDGKKVTLSFKAKSNISGKRFGYTIYQYYGTGGSPSGSSRLGGGAVTLTSSWQSIEFTVNTLSLSGKTFGTNNDDGFIIEFWLEWGIDYVDRFIISDAEGFRGAGDIEIAQVQLCAGDVALPFDPKSFADELRDCQIYFEKSWRYGTPVGKAGAVTGAEMATIPYLIDTGTMNGGVFKVNKRIYAPTVTLYSTLDGTTGKVYDMDGDTNLTFDASGYPSDRNFLIQNGAGVLTDKRIRYHWTADARF